MRSKPTNIEIYAQGFYEDSFKNAVPGTIIDNMITNSSEDVHEFYMLSQSSRFGMAPPTRCTVLHNQLTDSVASVHLLTYKLCHTYFNIPSAMRVPSPILYA